MQKARLTNLITLDKARETLARAVSPLSLVREPLAQVAGLLLAEDVHSDAALPREDVSAMDGYALRSADLNGSPLPVSREIPAGSAGGKLAPGTSARIFTGAVVPDGADTVVPQELVVRVDSGRVHLPPIAPGSYIRKSGELYARGAVLARKGDQLTPARIALLASGGVAKVPVYPRVRIAVIVTGSELVTADETPEPGQIRDSNGPMLHALATGAGILHCSTEFAADDPASLRTTLEHALNHADIVLISGGVSVGDYDYVPQTIAELDGETLFHGVSMKPGKPVLAARVGKSWLVGLPGNPLSVLAGWRMFVLPLILALQGSAVAFDEQPLTATLAGELHNRGDRTLLHPGTCEFEPDGTVTLHPLPWKGSHDIYMGSRAEVWIRLEPGDSIVAGEQAGYYQIERLAAASSTKKMPSEPGKDQVSSIGKQQ